MPVFKLKKNGVWESVTGGVDIGTDSDAVLYAEQIPSAEQQAQARANIGAVAAPVPVAYLYNGIRLRMITYILNLIDLAFTLYAISHGACELNPFMRCVPFQVFYKVFVIGALLYLLFKVNSRLARLGLRSCTAAFAVVNLWHIINIATSKWMVLS